MPKTSKYQAFDSIFFVIIICENVVILGLKNP